MGLRATDLTATAGALPGTLDLGGLSLDRCAALLSLGGSRLSGLLGRARCLAALLGLDGFELLLAPARGALALSLALARVAPGQETLAPLVAGGMALLALLATGQRLLAPSLFALARSLLRTAALALLLAALLLTLALALLLPTLCLSRAGHTGLRATRLDAS
jgi:hypothetical protein